MKIELSEKEVEIIAKALRPDAFNLDPDDVRMTFSEWLELRQGIREDEREEDE